jgi:hypothetical protein
MKDKWVGWYVFGSVLMITIGVFKAISGIIGLFRDQYLLVGYNGYMLVDITGLAWWWLAVGVVLLLGGLAAIKGKTWGRVVGTVAGAVALVSELFMITVYPVWSVLLIAMYVFVLVSFIVVNPRATD